MTRLKLSDLAADKPVKVSMELPAAVHHDLVAYAAILGAETPEKLIAPMLSRFMATDRAFLKAKRGGQPVPKTG